MKSASSLVRPADGFWTYTSEPASPMIYPYFFVVDGTPTATAPEEDPEIAGKLTY